MMNIIPRTVAAMVAAALLAAGCGGEAEPATADEAPEVSGRTAIPLDTLDVSSPGLTACTLSVTPDGPEWEISLIWTGGEVGNDFHSIHTVCLNALDGEESQTFDGLDANVFDIMEPSAYLITEDMDFDGYTDFRLMEFPTAGPNTYWLFWLFDPTESLFRRAYAWEDLGLVSPDFLPEENSVRSFSRDGYGLYETRWFSMSERMPVLVRREYTEWEGDTLFSVTEELLDGLMTETSREVSVDEGL